MKVLVVFLMLLSNGFLFAQTFDTISLRSIFVNDFCLGDSKTQLYEALGEPSKVELGVVDEAYENTLPAQNIFYYDGNWFSEPYLVSRNRIGGFNIVSDTCLKVRIVASGDTMVFRLNDRLDNKELSKMFPCSMDFSNSIFNKKEEYNRDAYLVLKTKDQSSFFKYPYPLIYSLTFLYNDSLLHTIETDYYKE